MNQARRLQWILMTLLCFCAGCASTLTVQANGSRKADQPIPPHVTYAVFPTDEVKEDPAFPAYARLVAREMAKRDYKETDAKVAKLSVYLAYGVSEQAIRNQSTGAPQPSGYPGGSGGSSGYGTVASSSPGSSGFPRYVSQVVVIVADMAQSRAAGSVAELWRGEAQSTGPSKDMSTVAPVLVEAAFRHFGEATPGPVWHAFTEEEVKAIQQAR